MKSCCPFDDAGWTGVAGWGSVGPMKPLSSVKQLMISSGGGTNTLAIDNIRFLKASEISDPYSIADFDGYADKTALEADWESADGRLPSISTARRPRPANP